MTAFAINDGMEAAHRAATSVQRKAVRDDLKAAATSLVHAARRIIEFSPVHGDDVLAARILEVQDFILKTAILFDFASASEAEANHVFTPIDMSPGIAIDCSADA